MADMRDMGLKAHLTSLTLSVEKVTLVLSLVALAEIPGRQSHWLTLSHCGWRDRIELNRTCDHLCGQEERIKEITGSVSVPTKHEEEVVLGKRDSEF